LVGLSCASPEAVAQSAAPHEIPADCGTNAEFEREVRRRLGAEARPLPTAIVIEREGDGYVLRMRVGNEQRELRDRDCRELFRAAVVVAVAIAFSEAKSESVPSPAAPRVAEEPARRPQPPGSDDPPGEGVHVDLGLAGGAHLGFSPSVVPLLELESKLTLSRFGIALGIRYLAPSSAEDETGRGVDVSGFGAQASALYAGSPLWEARAGVALFRLDGAGIGSASNDSDVAWAGGPVVGLALFPVRHGRFWAGAALQGEWHVLRARFEIQSYGEVFQVSPFGGSALLCAGYRLF
jgi:hypothetical protein